MKTDIRIINWIREGLIQGAEINAGDDVTGCIPEQGQFYGGAHRGMIPFAHTVTAQDINGALSAGASMDVK